MLRGIVLIFFALAISSAGILSALAQDDDPQATIAALETRVAELEAQLPPAEPTPGAQRIPESTDAFELGPGLVVLNYRFVASGLYRADSGDEATFVLGEIQNTTDQVLDAPGLRFVLLDAQGNVIGNIDADPILPIIRPGQVMPFESAIFGDEPDPSEWTTEDVSVCGTWGSTDRVDRFDPTGLELREVDAGGGPDSLELNGTVFNGRDTPAESVWVKAAIYDEDGRFSGWIWTVIEVPIPVGKTARFEFNSFGTPHDPIGVAGPGFTYELWVGFDSSFSIC